MNLSLDKAIDAVSIRHRHRRQIIITFKRYHATTYNIDYFENLRKIIPNAPINDQSQLFFVQISNN